MQLQIKTSSRSEMIDITSKVQDAIKIDGKAVIVYSPHTTCGITINEGHDPDVKHDILKKLDLLFPKDEHYFKHAEGNSDSHLKTAFVGTSAIIPIIDKKLMLGTWQKIFLCEFDGPRNRTINIQIL